MRSRLRKTKKRLATRLQKMARRYAKQRGGATDPFAVKNHYFSMKELLEKVISVALEKSQIAQPGALTEPPKPTVNRMQATDLEYVSEMFEGMLTTKNSLERGYVAFLKEVLETKRMPLILPDHIINPYSNGTPAEVKTRILIMAAYNDLQLARSFFRLDTTIPTFKDENVHQRAAYILVKRAFRKVAEVMNEVETTFQNSLLIATMGTRLSNSVRNRIYLALKEAANRAAERPAATAISATIATRGAVLYVAGIDVADFLGKTAGGTLPIRAVKMFSGLYTMLASFIRAFILQSTETILGRGLDVQSFLDSPIVATIITLLALFIINDYDKKTTGFTNTTLIDRFFSALRANAGNLLNGFKGTIGLLEWLLKKIPFASISAAIGSKVTASSGSAATAYPKDEDLPAVETEIEKTLSQNLDILTKALQQEANANPKIKETVLGAANEIAAESQSAKNTAASPTAASSSAAAAAGSGSGGKNAAAAIKRTSSVNVAAEIVRKGGIRTQDRQFIIPSRDSERSLINQLTNRMEAREVKKLADQEITEGIADDLLVNERSWFAGFGGRMISTIKSIFVRADSAEAVINAEVTQGILHSEASAASRLDSTIASLQVAGLNVGAGTGLGAGASSASSAAAATTSGPPVPPAVAAGQQKARIEDPRVEIEESQFAELRKNRLLADSTDEDDLELAGKQVIATQNDAYKTGIVEPGVADAAAEIGKIAAATAAQVTEDAELLAKAQSSGQVIVGKTDEEAKQGVAEVAGAANSPKTQEKAKGRGRGKVTASSSRKRALASIAEEGEGEEEESAAAASKTRRRQYRRWATRRKSHRKNRK